MYEIILGVEGMRCGMCEAHVNDAIRNNFKVKKVESSHDKIPDCYIIGGGNCSG